MIERFVAVLSGLVVAAPLVMAQSIQKPELDSSTIDPTPAEVALATQCRNAYDLMEAIKEKMSAERDELNDLAAKMTETGGELDAAEKDFDEKKEKSSQSQEAYDAAVKARDFYKEKAAEHNALVDKQIAATARHNGHADEFNDLNKKYYDSCSGRKFNATAVILTCKDEASAWCDLLR